MASRKRIHFQDKWRRFWWGILIAAIGLLIVVACSPNTETVTVEVTRIVTETVVTEGEAVEVTRVVTEVETVEVAPEAEPGGDLPSAIGSEGDAEPLPAPPNEGPKVTERRGSTEVAALGTETAVTLRANETNVNTAPTTAVVAAATISPVELQKWCALAAEFYKKRCG